MGYDPVECDLSSNRVVTVRKRIQSGGLLLAFVFVVVSASFACADIKPFGVYQRGAAHAGHRAGVGRAAARNFKAGFVVAKNNRSSKLRKNLYKHLGSGLGAGRIDTTVWTPEASFLVPRSFILDLSPVLNL